MFISISIAKNFVKIIPLNKPRLRIKTPRVKWRMNMKLRVLRSIGLYLQGYFEPDGKRMQAADSPCFSIHPAAVLPAGQIFYAILATGPDGW